MSFGYISMWILQNNEGEQMILLPLVIDLFLSCLPSLVLKTLFAINLSSNGHTLNIFV